MRSILTMGDGPYGLPLMKFTLTFDGELPPTANSGSRKSEKKWAIRRHFAPQFEELWRVIPALQHISRGYFISPNTNFLVVDTHHQIGRTDLPALGAEGNKVDLCAPIERQCSL
jgi:hypothetical protein